MFGEYLRYALGSIKRRKLRTFLTLLGVIIGIATIVSLISIGQGLQQSVTAQFSFLTPDIFTVVAGGHFDPSENVPDPFDMKTLKGIERVKGVRDVIPVTMHSTRLRGDDTTSYVEIFGISDGKYRDSFYDTFKLKIEKGEFLKDSEKGKVVIGIKIAEDAVFSKPLQVGDKIKLGEEDFDIVGILKEQGKEFVDELILMNEDDLITRYDRPKDQFSMIGGRVNNPDEIKPVVEKIKDRLRKIRDVESGNENFKMLAYYDIIETEKKAQRGLNIFIYVIASVSLFAGAVGIFITMVTSVLERTKEIGVLKAIGATNNTVFSIILSESCLLGLFGGLAGIVLAVLLSYIITITGVIDFEGFKPHFNAILLISSVLISVVLGGVSGILPAIRASKMNPSESMRES